MISSARLAAPIVLVGLSSIAGCGSSGSPSDSAGSASSESSARPSTTFAAMTDGPPAELLAHIRQLDESYRLANSSDVDTARANLLAYTRAVEATGKALMARKEAPEEARGKGALAVLKALQDRTELDPKAFEALLAAADRMEAENPKTRIATLAAISRYEQINDATDEVLGSPAARLDRVVDALVRLARIDPPYPKTPELIRETINKAGNLDRYDLVETLHRLYAKQYPDDPYATYSLGAANLAALHGKTVEDFSGKDILDGKPIDLKAMRGKIVLIDFWATWCAPCMEEMPKLLEAHRRLAPYGFELIGFNLDPTPEGVRTVAAALGSTWPQLFEANARGDGLTSETIKRFGIAQIPFKLLIDPDGKLVATGHSFQEIMPKLIPLLEKSSQQKKAAQEAEAKKKGESKKEGN